MGWGSSGRGRARWLFDALLRDDVSQRWRYTFDVGSYRGDATIALSEVSPIAGRAANAARAIEKMTSGEAQRLANVTATEIENDLG